MKKLIATLAIAGAMGTAGLFAQTGESIEDLSISATLDYESSYIFRGIKFNEDSFQPGAEFGFPVLGGDLYAGAWANLPITGVGSNANELDFYGGFAYPVTDIITVDAGFTYYWFPNGVSLDRQQGATEPDNALAAYVEPYVGASFDVLLSPAIYIFYSLDQGGGSSYDILTIEASIGYSFDLAEYVGLEGLSLDLGAYAGVLIPDDSVEAGLQSAFYGGITADLVYSFNENVSSSVGFRYSNFSLDGGPAGGADPYANSQNNIWVGATLGFAY
ncbi:MAG: TorF family putative porin [Verrucomicrobiota bacterium]